MALRLPPWAAPQSAWAVSHERLALATRKPEQFIDITERVCCCARQSGIGDGTVTVQSLHTTAAILVNENEPLLLQDMEEFLRRIAHPDAYYRHNDFTVRTVNMTEDECPNGHAHCQNLLMSTSETLPIVGGEVQLGTWQRIFLVELDTYRPRPRQVLLTVLRA